MIDRFHIIEFGAARPDADRIIFCDGTGGELFRADSDLELSHWRPNRTPAEYRAGTSTEICFRFLDNPRPGSWTAAVNNHVDVDGILSVYVLVESAHALAHRQTLIEAAEMGDFWSWGEPPAQRVFQGLTWLMQQEDRPEATYAEAFRRIPGLIDGTDPQCAEIDASLAPLRRNLELIEQGRIERHELAPRLTHYLVPRPLAGTDEQASYVPDFNEAISSRMIFWPHARARWDAERVCLVSTERTGGWLHDLWYPGYLWADTQGKWIPADLTYHEGMSRYTLGHEVLIAAIDQLQRQESALGQWTLGGTTMPLSDVLQQRFPLVGRLLTHDGQPAVSSLPPTTVADILTP
jgi:hypothetical protein